MQSVFFQFESFPDFVVEINLAPCFSSISRATDSASGESGEMPRSLRVFRISASMDLSSAIKSSGSAENGKGKTMA